jgi:hypothetical protein
MKPAARKRGSTVVTPDAKGAKASVDLQHVRSNETYIGYNQASNFVSPGGVGADIEQIYKPGRF